MLGKPKYKYNQTVKFDLGDKEYVGKIYIIDEYGTFGDPSDVSYDIMVEKFNGRDDCLVKHITESLVKEYNINQ